MNILVFGNFGLQSNKLDGQTVKTRQVEELLKKYSQHNICRFDTDCLKNNKWKIFELLISLWNCDKLIYLPAHSNLKYIFPFVFLFSYIAQYKIVYIVIGGWLVEFLQHKYLCRLMLSKVEAILVETKLLKERLAFKYGYTNVSVLYNFRKFPSMSRMHDHEGLRLVFVGRVQIQKGIDYIFLLAEYIQKMKENINIDIYGQIDVECKEYFYNMIARYTVVQYCGYLEPQEIYSVLGKYDVLLFPTHYYTEGLPGSIVDAYISGLPVIATNWLHANEFIRDGIDGFVIPFENSGKKFIESVLKLQSDKALLNTMKRNVVNRRNIFSFPVAWKILSTFVDGV